MVVVRKILENVVYVVQEKTKCQVIKKKYQLVQKIYQAVKLILLEGMLFQIDLVLIV